MTFLANAAGFIHFDTESLDSHHSSDWFKWFMATYGVYMRASPCLVNIYLSKSTCLATPICSSIEDGVILNYSVVFKFMLGKP